MVAYHYDTKVAFIKGSPNTVAANATVLVYDTTDTGYTTPLVTYSDPALTVIVNLVSDAYGIVPDFWTNNKPDVLWKSGSMTGGWATTQSRPGIQGPVSTVPGPPGPPGTPGTPGLNGAGTNADVAAYVPVSGPTRDALDARYPTITSNNAALALKSDKSVLPVYAKDHGVTGDGVTDDTSAMVAALVAAAGKALIMPPGVVKIASATRLQLYASYSSIVGDPSGISTIRFTHASGGIDVGDGTNFVYQTLIQNIVIDGFNVANNPLRLRKSEEMGMVNTRVHQALVSAIEMTDTSLFHSNRLQVARAPIGIKQLGYMGTVGLNDANFYLLDIIVSVEGTGVANLLFSGVTFIEAVKVGISFNRPSGLISVGTIHFRDCYITSALTEFCLFKGIASTGVNASALLASNLNAYLPSVTTTPFIDFTALNNNGSTLNARISSATYTLTALGAGKLVAVHASQNWYQFFVTLEKISGATTAQYATTFVTGGVALTPLMVAGSGTPEAAITAPVGSLYQNYGGGAGTSLYVKETGTGNTGWVGK